MFKKQMVCYIKEVEALDFCEYIGKRGFKFTIRKCHRKMTDKDGRGIRYVVFRIYVPVHKFKSFEKELKAKFMF